MKTIRHPLFAAIPLVILTSVLSADTPRRVALPPNTPVREILEDSATRQAQLKRSFEAFRNKLAHLASRLEGGSDIDRLRAQSLRKALKLIGQQGTEGRFDTLIRALSKNDTSDNLDNLRDIIADNKELRQDLQRLLKLLLEGDPARARAKKIADLGKLIDQIKRVRDRQARLQVQTERGKHDTKELATTQEKITRETRDILKPTADEKMREPIRKPVEDAIAAQQKASEQLQGDQSEGASELQGRAVTRLEDAIRILEEQLRQQRQEERQQRLTDLLARAKRMLALQIEVRDANAVLDRDIRKAGQVAVSHSARANKLADKETAILSEAVSALKLVRSDAAAVAFAEVFDDLSDDIETLRDRLLRTDTGTVTQSVAEDVIDSLKQIIRALEKGLREQEPPKNPGPPGCGPNNPPPLVDKVQQLKMLLGMQKRIHDRTSLYGKRILGEQLPELPASATAQEKRDHAAIRKELRSLASRQDRLGKATREVGKQAGEQTRID